MPLDDRIFIPDFLNPNLDYSDVIKTQYSNGMYHPLEMSLNEVLEPLFQINPDLERNIINYQSKSRFPIGISKTMTLCAFYYGDHYLCVRDFVKMRRLLESDYRLGKAFYDNCARQLRQDVSELNKLGIEINNNLRGKGYYIAGHQKDCRNGLTEVDTKYYDSDNELPFFGYNPFSNHIFIGDDCEGIALTTGEMEIFSRLTEKGAQTIGKNNSLNVQINHINEKIKEKFEGKYYLQKIRNSGLRLKIDSDKKE